VDASYVTRIEKEVGHIATHWIYEEVEVDEEDEAI